MRNKFSLDNTFIIFYGQVYSDLVFKHSVMALTKKQRVRIWFKYPSLRVLKKFAPAERIKFVNQTL